LIHELFIRDVDAVDANVILKSGIVQQMVNLLGFKDFISIAALALHK